jgi:hypothetical protein
VDALRGSYPAQQIDAYIEGRFVNLTSGTVYNAYDREANRSAEVMGENEPLHIGQDFNVNNMASEVFVKRDNGWHLVDELQGLRDTPHLIEVLKDRYKTHAVFIYPDASGGSRKTVNASESDLDMLRRAGFKVRNPSANPRVRDRILAVNGAISAGKVWVNDTKAPRAAEALEQQAYDKNGEPDKTTGHDHPADALGYFVHYTLPIRKPVVFPGIRMG